MTTIGYEPVTPLGEDARLWPLTAHRGARGEVFVGGVGLTRVAKQCGTPTHVVDEADIRRRCHDYQRAFDGEVAYAGKAFLCRTMARWVQQEGLSLDVCSAGELAVARAAGFPAEQILLHGNAKTPQDLAAALAYRVSRIVLDSETEITRLAALVGRSPHGRRQQVLIRVTPGVDAHSHRAITTGTDDQKFGFSLASGAAEEAVARVLARPELDLVGLHCHIGSQVEQIEALERAAELMVELLARIRDTHGRTLSQLDLGGGHAVAYRDYDTGSDPAELAPRLSAAVANACATHRLPVPHLIVEPGRAISARAGVTLYRVISVKRTAAGRVFVAVDGGMSDNPRPALYGARYTIRLIGRPAPGPHQLTTVVGRHCEAGDVLAEDCLLPNDIHPGDLLAMLCTGAYHHAMSSNYNLVPRPPVIALSNGTARVLIRRETDADLLRRDVGGVF
ncbi:diaminopimelate decarboxylase [Micromonospora sp. IBHARD004]|uniref:diaminopimelate decarboxylase n=1 Tax=Micromonospora sp. IBHARD004 TaxID=3457764 RepID=UPI004057CD35